MVSIESNNESSSFNRSEYKEAQNSESKADFIHKMKIAAKEAEELEFYFEVCNEATELPSANELLNEVQSVIKVLNKIIATSKQKLNHPK